MDIPAGAVAISIEALFNQKGARLSDPNDDFELAIDLDYIEIPILVKVPFTPDSAVRPFVYAGLAPAFNVSATAREEFDGQELEEDLGDDVKALDLGLVFGGGVRFGAAGVEARYTHGLMDINDDGADDVLKILNRQFAVLVSFSFGGR